MEAAGRELARWLDMHRTRYPLNRDFAIEIGMSEAWLSKLLNGKKIAGPTQAVRIQIVTKGALPASLFRPDLWRRPEDVPVERLHAEARP